jgi:hypothetical protein
MNKEVLRLMAFAMTAAVVMVTVRTGHANQARANEWPALAVHAKAGEAR